MLKPLLIRISVTCRVCNLLCIRKKRLISPFFLLNPDFINTDMFNEFKFATQSVTTLVLIQQVIEKLVDIEKIHFAFQKKKKNPTQSIFTFHSFICNRV